MVSIERLFCLISPQAISAEPIYGKGVFSREDAAGVVGQVQHAGFAVGVHVLESKIGGNANSRQRLVQAVTAVNTNNGVSHHIANMLAEMAVHEVCDSHACPKCKGSGISFSKRYNRIGHCSRCEGTGHTNSSMRDLAGVFSVLTQTKCSTPEFRLQFYDRFMEAVDALYKEEGEAINACKKVLNALAAEA